MIRSRHKIRAAADRTTLLRQGLEIKDIPHVHETNAHCTKIGKANANHSANVAQNSLRLGAMQTLVLAGG